MYKKLLVYLAILLCALLLYGYGWMLRQTEILEGQSAVLQEELRELRAENDALACRLAELRELQAIQEETVVCRK